MAQIPARDRIVIVAILLLAALAGVLHEAGTEPLVVFGVSAAALAGLAWIVAFSTEAVGTRLSPAMTGVLQSTLGNLPELFVVLFALNAGEIVVAQTSIIGSLFANALLVLGLAIMAGSAKAPDGVMRFGKKLPNDTSTLLILAVFIIALLGISDTVGDRASHHQTAISVFGACVLLLVYGAWLVGYLRGPQVAHEAGHAASKVTMRTAITLLAIAGVGAALVSDWFVASITPAADALGVSKAFVGLVIVAIAGNAVENVAGVFLAAKGKNELAVSVIKNSVAQIAVFLFPVLVLLSLFFATPLTFVLSPIYVVALVLMAIAVWQITGDGEATPFEGAALVGIYLILAFLTFFE
jgi:Ca2+:H+ antiporter